MKPSQIAVNYNIPYVFYAEHGESEMKIWRKNIKELGILQRLLKTCPHCR